jgi:hypothetical protein
MPSTIIDLKFIRAGATSLLHTGAFPYRSVVSTADSLEIFNKRILIRTTRSTKANPLQAHNSTFYKQIIKSLCLYYIVERKPNQLKEISIVRLRNGHVIPVASVPKSTIRQVVAKSTDLTTLSSIDPSKAAILLLETSVGRSVLNAATHLIKSLDSPSPFDRFERLWRAFNALYKAFAKVNTDHGCHVALRDHIKNNPGLFPLALAKVSTLTAVNIRANIRWNQMLLNNYATQAKTTALRDSIFRNSDPRILEIYQSSLPLRHAFLTAAGFLAPVNAYITNGINANVACDADVLSTLCIKYSYFVRNKIAHAEKSDHGFSFLHGSSEESEIRWLVTFLEPLVIDLINVSDTF